MIAALLDDAILGAVAFVSVGGDQGAALSLTPVFGQAGAVNGGWVIVAFAAMIAMIAMQAYTGSSPGKVVMAVAVLDSGSGRPLGLWPTVLRWLAHLLDAILLVGYLRPLWNPEQRTFADSVVGSDAVVLLPRAGWRRPFLPAAVIASVVGVAFGSVGSSTGTSSSAGCEMTPTGAGSPTVTVATATWYPPTQTVTRLWITRQIPVEGGARLTVSWQTDDMEIDAGDGTMRIDVVDDAGLGRRADAQTVQASTTLTFEDSTPRDLSFQQVIDGVVARCEAVLP